MEIITQDYLESVSVNVLIVEFKAIIGDDLFVPEGAVFGEALLGFVINPDHAEALVVAFGPLEIV